MEVRDLVLKNCSYRRFFQDVPVSRETLERLVDLARLSASSGKLQPLKYRLVWEPQENELVFPLLGWAGYLKDWPGPEEGERPSAYVLILGDKTIREKFGCDHGIAAQSILLGAVAKGLGGCIIASSRKNELRRILNIPEPLELLLVIALGKPKERVELDTVGPDGNIEYWRGESGTHHVPKRSLNSVKIG